MTREAETTAAGDRTLSVGGQPVITLLSPPARIDAAFATHHHHVRSGPLDDRGAVRIRFERPGPGPWVHLSSLEADAAAAPGSFCSVDGDGRLAELPVTGAERELLADPELDASFQGGLHHYVQRLVEQRCSAHGMVRMKAAVVDLPEGAVAIVGFDGSGKTTTMTALLEHATGFLCDERAFLLGDGRVAGLTTLVAHSLGRPDVLPSGALDAVPASRLRASRALSVLGDLAPGRVGRRLKAEASNRWVEIDVRATHPHLALPEKVRLAAFVHLLPTDGGSISIDRMSEAHNVARVQEQLRYLHTVTAVMQAMFRYAHPDLGEWPHADLAPMLERVPGYVAGVPAFAVTTPRGAPATEVAAAVRRALR